MRIFDQINPQDLERREWQLWILVLATLAVFACAIVLLMYPAVFLNPLVVSGSELRKAFFGFCLLSILLLAYLANRQVVLVRTRSSVISKGESISQGFRQFQKEVASLREQAIAAESPLRVGERLSGDSRPTQAKHSAP